MTTTPLQVGNLAPHFEGNNQHGQKVDLQQFKGKKVALYFYPKDDTPGCTAQACSLRDGIGELLSQGIEVVGISPDSEKSHLKFADKFQLPFNLIADPNRDIVQAYGVWGEKMFMGKVHIGVIRTTFLINEAGVIEHIFTKVDTKDHAQQILKTI